MFFEGKDQMSRIIRLAAKPNRIVSLVPSQTEYLAFLGLDHQVVGITKFCIHPAHWFSSKTRVGGTKNVDIERVRQLQPDFIIANKEENTLSDIEALEQIAPVYLSDVIDKESALEMLLQIGQITGKDDIAEDLVKRITGELALVTARTPSFTYLYFMWKDPYYTVGKSTFISNWLREFGGINLQEGERYPEYSFSETYQPQVVFLSSEPYPFNASHLSFFQERFPLSSIVFIDGEMASWYGNRMLPATSYLKNLIETLAL